MERNPTKTTFAGARVAEITSTIGILSTGDELINGDVLNTNSQIIAKRLRDLDIQPGLQACASDDQAQIATALKFLLDHHAAVIITGGLGPTSDDRTRFAVSQVLKTELVFHEVCWQWIVERLQRLGLPVPETNRQQCLFPEDATIFANDNGTAAAALLVFEKKPVFMLPGPPNECLPIFEAKVLPYLQTHGYARKLFRCEWLLLGKSESSIAATLDPLAENSGCYIGYRVNMPYVEVKLQSADAIALEKLRTEIDKIIGAFSVSAHKETACMQLRRWIIESQSRLCISDHATGGRLAAALLTPETYPFLTFDTASHPAHSSAIRITLSGLTPYWQDQTGENILQMDIQTAGQSKRVNLAIPLRKERTLLFAVEMVCWELLKAFDDF